MKISISKNKEGTGYYTTLKNNYKNENLKMYMTVQLKQGLEVDYGVYDVNCFLSCYKTQSGEIKPKLVITEIKGKPATTKEETTNDPFELFGNEIEIDLNDNDLLD